MVVSGGKCLPFYSGTEAMLHLTPMLFSFDYDLHLTCKLREQNDNNLLSAYNGIQRPIPFVNLNKKDDIIVNSLLVYYLNGYGWHIPDFSKVMLEANLNSLGLTSQIDPIRDFVGSTYTDEDGNPYIHNICHHSQSPYDFPDISIYNPFQFYYRGPRFSPARCNPHCIRVSSISLKVDKHPNNPNRAFECIHSIDVTDLVLETRNTEFHGQNGDLLKNMTTNVLKPRWSYVSTLSEARIIKISNVWYPYLDSLLENFLAMNTQRAGYFKHWKSQIKLCFLAKMLKDRDINCAFYNDDVQVITMNLWAISVVEFLYTNPGARDYRTQGTVNLAALNSELDYNHNNAQRGPLQLTHFQNRQELSPNLGVIPQHCQANRNLSIIPQGFPDTLLNLIGTAQGAIIAYFVDIVDNTMYTNVFNYTLNNGARTKAQDLTQHPTSWATKIYNWVNKPNFTTAKQYLLVYTLGGSPKLNEYLITATATEGFQGIDAGFHNNPAFSSQTPYTPLPATGLAPGYFDTLKEMLKLYSDDNNNNFRQDVSVGTNFPENGIWVYRGVRLLNLKDGSTPHNFKDMIGRTIPQFAFASTSIDPYVAIHFQKYNGGGNYGHSCCVYKIKIRKESRVLYLYNSQITTLSLVAGEEEILLPYGCHLRIINVNYEYLSSGHRIGQLGETIAEQNQKLLVITCELIDSEVLKQRDLNIVQKTNQIINDTVNAYRGLHFADLNALIAGPGAPCCQPNAPPYEYGYGAQPNAPLYEYGYGAQPYPGVRRNSIIWNRAEDLSPIGDEFVRLLPIFSELEEVAQVNYTKKALRQFKGYRNNLNNIKLTKFDEGKENEDDYIVGYIRDFCKQIFNNISTKYYPTNDNGNIPRCGHGGLNHLRSLKGGVLVIKLLMESELVKNKPLFKKIFKTKSFLVMLILSTMFESIMRIDERGSGGVLCGLTGTAFRKLYPSLDYNNLGKGKLSPHQMASSALHLALMRKCFGGNIDDEIIQTLSRGVSYHWDPIVDDINIGGKNISEINSPNNLMFFIYYVIIIVGHYLDHCRNWYFSHMINNPDISVLLDLFKIKRPEKIKLIKKVVQTLRDTEFSNYDGSINNINDIDMQESCKKLEDKKVRGSCIATDNDFIERAIIFEVAWRDIKLLDVIRDLLTTSEAAKIGGKRRTRKSVRKHRGGSKIQSVDLDDLLMSNPKIPSKEMPSSLMSYPKMPSKEMQFSKLNFEKILKTEKTKSKRKTNQKINLKIDKKLKFVNQRPKMTIHSVIEIQNTFLINLWKKFPKVCNIINISEKVLIKSLTNEKNKQLSFKNIDGDFNNLKKYLMTKNNKKEDDLTKNNKKAGGLKRKVKKGGLKRKEKKDGLKRKVKKEKKAKK